MQQTIENLLEHYFETLNTQDTETLLTMLSDDVMHDINQGEREVGKTAFARYLERLNAHYREHIYDIEIMINKDGTRAAAEYTVLGVYLLTDPGLPAASGQTYRLPGGSFFELCDGKIARVSVHYNFQDWLAQVAFQDALLLSADTCEASA